MAAKEAAVWPEGNEASPGGATSSSGAEGLSAKGRTRSTRGLMVRLHTSRSSTREQAHKIPRLR